MKLVHPEIHFQIQFSEQEIPVLVVESPIRWRTIQRELFAQYSGGDGKWVLSHEDKEIKIQKSVEMVLNPIQLEENQKRIMNRFLQSLAEKAVSENYWKKGQQLNAEIQKFFGELEMEYSFGYHINQEIDFSAMAKAMNIQIENEYESDLERLFQYCLIASEILGVKLFFFWNLHQYFTSQELEQLYQEIIVRKWNVLLLESSVSNNVPGERYYIVDKDNCEIY